MVSKLCKFIEKEELLDANDKILLAISGGIDSMCMLDLFSKLDYNIAVCHINHSLRGTESDEDARFVEHRCTVLDVPFHLFKIDTLSEVEKQKGNVQEIARQIRYKHFQQLVRTHSYTKIATAHNADDRIETFMMNAIDGTGLTGLKSIPAQNGIIVRPLIHCTRAEIEEHTHNHDVAYREDRSNHSLKYRRNKIRHQLMPVLLDIKPTASQGFKTTIENINNSQKLLTHLVQEYWEKFHNPLPNGFMIDRAILKTPGIQSLLFLELSKFGFNRNQIQQLLAHPTNYGNEFESHTHSLHVERTGFRVILKNDLKIQNEISISSVGTYQINHGLKLVIEKVTEIELNTDPNVEFVNSASLTFPCTIRYWKEGDHFQPIGMHGKSQSLQDYFVNQKIDKIKKRSTPLLVAQGNIIWVMGHRLSQLARITNESKGSYKLNLIEMNVY